MMNQELTTAYLLQQVNKFKHWSVTLALSYVIVSFVLDYARFPYHLMGEVCTTRLITMLLPMLIFCAVFYGREKLNMSPSTVNMFSFFAVTMIGVGHSEVLMIADTYGVHFPKVGITIVLIYAGLLLAMPLTLSILGSVTIIGFTCYTYSVIGMDLGSVLTYLSFYSMLSSCCLLSNYACIRIIRTNMSLMVRTNELATTDELTGLSNRRCYYLKAEQMLEKSNLNEKRLVLILIDLDNFKAVNDLIGHKQGDKVLKEMAHVIKLNSRKKSDTCARLGGDEFVMLLYDVTLQQVEKICQNLIDKAARISKLLSIKNPAIDLGVSIGVAYNEPEESYSISFLMEAADQSLYKIKNTGKNNFVINASGEFEETKVAS